MQTRNDPGDLLGSAALVDNLLDAFLYGIGAYILIDSLQSNFSAAQAGLAAFGGASTLVISLASQGLVSQVFYGLFLAASNKIRKGDVVSFGDGNIKGMIANTGWTDTLVRGSDGIMVSVPNKELGTSSSNWFKSHLLFCDRLLVNLVSSLSFLLGQPTNRFETYRGFKCLPYNKSYSLSLAMPTKSHSLWKISRMK